MFWYYFYATLTTESTLSTARAREYVVREEVEIVSITEQEALRALELASTGHYSLDDIPTQWREYFQQVERQLGERN